MSGVSWLYTAKSLEGLTAIQVGAGGAAVPDAVSGTFPAAAMMARTRGNSVF